MKVSKETLIRTAKTILGRMPENVEYIADNRYGCEYIKCENCPCSTNNNADDIFCGMHGKTWLKNWLEENKSKEVIMNEEEFKPVGEWSLSVGIKLPSQKPKILKLHKIEGNLKSIREDADKAEIRAFECRGREDNMTLLASYGKNGFEYFNAPHTPDDMKKIVEWAGNLLQEVEA